jgi:hypothetical protein
MRQTVEDSAILATPEPLATPSLAAPAVLDINGFDRDGFSFCPRCWARCGTIERKGCAMKRLSLLAFSAAMGIWALASIPAGDEASKLSGTKAIRIPAGHPQGARARVWREEVAAIPNSPGRDSVLAYRAR